MYVSADVLSMSMFYTLWQHNTVMDVLSHAHTICTENSYAVGGGWVVDVIVVSSSILYTCTCAIRYSVLVDTALTCKR